MTLLKVQKITDRWVLANVMPKTGYKDIYNKPVNQPKIEPKIMNSATTF